MKLEFGTKRLLDATKTKSIVKEFSEVWKISTINTFRNHFLIRLIYVLFVLQISAQESRRKKKEYMDQLERKVELMVAENHEYRKKVEDLEDSNNSLVSQIQKLQAIVAKIHPQLIKHSSK